MALDVLTLRVTYNPDLDVLYLTSSSCTGKWMDSQDGMFFYTVYNERTDARPSGFEVHHFREVWDDRSIIPSLEMRFDLTNGLWNGVCPRLPLSIPCR